jgi:excisionase family DNA binding protein
VEDQTRSLSEVAGLMGVSERTVRRWIKSGRLKAYKPGRDYRIPKSGLRAFIEESEISPKVQEPPSQPSFNDVLGEERRYSVLASLLEDWHYLIEQTAERHIQNASSNLFETEDGASAYSVAAYTELAQLFEICLERLSPTIHDTLPESLAEIEGGKLAQSMFRLEEAQVAISEAGGAAGVDLGHEQEFSPAELAMIEEAAREFEALPEFSQRLQIREAWEIVERLAETRIATARELTEEVRRQSSA